LLATESSIRKYNLKPRARIISEGIHSREPEWFTLAPVDAIKNSVKNSGLNQNDFDLFEINEAFSSVALACMKELNLDPKSVNTRGGAVALGNPIGASGARILLTLLNALEQQGKKRGIAGICNGGGEATSVAIELV
jgi:acetyl-CoA C-acetyltransferase